jgi:putative membrane protein
MDPKLLYWTCALANLAIIVACGARGVRAVRRGEIRTHRRMMLTATALVAVFLASYLLKVAWLGKEDRGAWTALDTTVLYTHESCIAAMLLAGGYALFKALRFQGRLGPGLALPPDAGALPGRAQHRRAGRIATWSGLLAFVTAVGVWAGMLLRSAD